MFTQDIPNYGTILEATNSFIVDWGVAVFAMVIFAIVIFGMMALMFMMLRQMGKESKQQNDILEIMKATIAKQAESDQRIGDNTAATTKQTESINTMNDKFEGLERAVLNAIQKMSELPSKTELTPESRAALISEITAGLKTTIKECIETAIKTAAQKTPEAKQQTTKAPGVPVTPKPNDKEEEKSE